MSSVMRVVLSDRIVAERAVARHRISTQRSATAVALGVLSSVPALGAAYETEDPGDVAIRTLPAGGAEDAAASAAGDGSGSAPTAIVVSARRRTENAQDVPIPIAAVGGAALEQAGQFRLESLNQSLPRPIATPAAPPNSQASGRTRSSIRTRPRSITFGCSRSRPLAGRRSSPSGAIRACRQAYRRPFRSEDGHRQSGTHRSDHPDGERSTIWQRPSIAPARWIATRTPESCLTARRRGRRPTTARRTASPLSWPTVLLQVGARRTPYNN